MGKKSYHQLKKQPRPAMQPVPQVPSHGECEAVPINPAVLEKVRQILKGRGFKQYQNA